MLQDLITAAVNDGVHQIKDGSARRWRASPAACRSPGCSARRRSPLAALIEPVARLIEALSRLPGVGPKTAQRLTYHLLRAPGVGGAHPRRGARRGARRGRLLRVVLQHLDRPAVPHLRRSVARRDAGVRRRGAARRARAGAHGAFKGRYHVLHGAISPMDGIGPERLRSASCSTVPPSAARDGEPYEEVVLATNPTLEGEATAMYLAERLQPDVRLDNTDRARDPGRRRPRVCRRGDARPGDAGPARVRATNGERADADEQPRHRDRCCGWSSRLIAALLGVVIYGVAIGLRGAGLGRACRWSAGSARAAFILLVQEGPI